MSTRTPAVPAQGGQLIRDWKTPIVLLVFTVAGTALFLGVPQDQEAILRLSPAGDAFALGDWVVNAHLLDAIALAASAALTGVAFTLTRAYRRVPLWLSALFAGLMLLAFVSWAGAAGSQSHTIPLPGLLAGALSLSVPLVFGSLAGVIGERVGVVNIAIEAQLLFGAFTSAIAATLTGSPWIGLLAAGLAGLAVAAVLAVFTVQFFVDQVIVGVVLNVLVLGLTNFFYSALLTPHRAELNTPPRFGVVSIPVLGDIPLIGPMFFRQTVIVYLMYLTLAVVAFALYRTRWGLRLRAVGEHPQAADTVGIRVARTRFMNVLLAGAIAGLGGSFFTLGSVGAFNKDMTAGAGFIALAAVIFGKWDPVRAALAGLLFGFAGNIQNTLGVIGSPVPSEFMLMLPYVVTVFAVAGLVGKVRGPAAAGRPYIK